MVIDSQDSPGHSQAFKARNDRDVLPFTAIRFRMFQRAAYIILLMSFINIIQHMYRIIS